MNRNTRKWLVVLGIIAVLVTAGIAAYAFQPANADGQITVVAPSFTAGTESARGNLLARINYAEARLAETDVASAANPSSPNTYWAVQATHNDLISAIAAARNVYTRAGIFSPGEEFDVTVNIDGNTGGFAAMLLRLQLPTQIQVVGITPGPDFNVAGTHHPSFMGGPGWNPDTYSVDPRSGDVIAGWAGREEGNFTANNTTLMTFRLRVTPGTAVNQTVGPIQLSFGTAIEPHTDAPVRINAGSNQPLSMSIQGQTGGTVNLGSVRVVAP